MSVAMVSSNSTPARPPELDELTLARAKRGETAACRALVLRYQGPVFALLGRMLAWQQREEVEDLAQECFLRVFRALPGFRLQGEAKLSSWILTIAARLAIDQLRRRRPPPLELSELDRLATSIDGDATPTQRLLLREAIEQMNQLRPEYRAAFALRVFHELSYEEIAAALEIELGTVKSRIARARAALQAAFAEDEDGR